MSTPRLDSLTPRGYRGLQQRFAAWVKRRTLTNKLPTFREAARRYHLNFDEIEQLISETRGLDLIVGIKTYSGHAAFEHRGMYQIEWFEDHEETV